MRNVSRSIFPLLFFCKVTMVSALRTNVSYHAVKTQRIKCRSALYLGHRTAYFNSHMLIYETVLGVTSSCRVFRTRHDGFDVIKLRPVCTLLANSHKVQLRGHHYVVRSCDLRHVTSR